MKTKTFGTKRYFVVTYYQKDGKIEQETEIYITQECAKNVHEINKKHKGAIVDKGEIIDSFIFLAKQCELID